jgi:hypothetical protein
MRRFRYLRDPLFHAAVAAYLLNRTLLKPHVLSPFLHDHFNDLLLIPAALPVVLWTQRIIGLRTHDLTPSWLEMVLHVAVWSVICELIGPFYLRHGTADLWDAVAYAVGGLAACLWWNRAGRRVALRQQWTSTCLHPLERPGDAPRSNQVHNLS